jgi:calmodulin
MKFFAPWCRACKGLAPKFRQVSTDPKYGHLPVVFAEMDVTHNKEFIRSLGVLALPSVHFYAGSDGLAENFPCGPSKVPILKRKLADFLNNNVDRETMELKLKSDLCDLSEAEPCAETPVETQSGEKVKVGDMALSDEQWRLFRHDIPYFKDLNDIEFQNVMSKATLQEFEPGSIIMRQGNEGKTFYVIESGEVEISVRTAYNDPMTAPTSYLGTVVNELTANMFFGERAMITGEPRAASIRCVTKSRFFAFNQADIPESSVLSGRKAATPERLAEVDDKYGVDVNKIDTIEMNQVLRGSAQASQKRGSVNTPDIIPGVDTEEADIENLVVAAKKEAVLPLLIRFKLIRHAARCFEYIMKTQPRWGDAGEEKRRSMLVSQLTDAQRHEFQDVFRMIDQSRDGRISVMELKKAMESAGSDKTDEEIYEMINKANSAVDGNTEITLQEFMGVMAEAEFFYLFLDTFNALDKYNTGFVRAADLDRVLCGMRDLISQDHMSIIDVEDKDMLVDYEQFSRMMLGATL